MIAYSESESESESRYFGPAWWESSTRSCSVLGSSLMIVIKYEIKYFSIDRPGACRLKYLGLIEGKSSRIPACWERIAERAGWRVTYIFFAGVAARWRRCCCTIHPITDFARLIPPSMASWEMHEQKLTSITRQLVCSSASLVWGNKVVDLQEELCYWTSPPLEIWTLRWCDI